MSLLSKVPLPAEAKYVLESSLLHMESMDDRLARIEGLLERLVVAAEASS